MPEPTTEEINVAFPEASERRLQIRVSPGQLKLAPGTGGEWVTGTYHDPTGILPLEVEERGGTVRIGQRFTRNRPHLKGMPVFDLRLGTANTYSLTIEAGANEEIACELGGLPLTRFEIKHGAGKVRAGFSTPNAAAMERLHLSAGATDVELSNLANANAAEIDVEIGAAALRLDFGGTLTRDAQARITAGAASVEIVVPSTVAAKIKPQATLGGVQVGDGFETREGGYWTKAAVEGGTPVLTIEAKIAVSGLKLRTM